MRVWRISNYADLSGKGGDYKAGRWNFKGDRIVYCADHPSTAMLELLVHTDRDDSPDSFQLIEIEVPDGIEVPAAALPENWRDDQDLTRKRFRQLSELKEAAVLRVPSVVMPFAWNYLIAPAHPDVGRFAIVSVSHHLVDPRFLR